MCIRDRYWGNQPHLPLLEEKLLGRIGHSLTGPFLSLSVTVILRRLPGRSDRRQKGPQMIEYYYTCLLYTSDAADDLLCVDLGGRRIIKKKKKKKQKKM